MDNPTYPKGKYAGPDTRNHHPFKLTLGEKLTNVLFPPPISVSYGYLPYTPTVKDQMHRSCCTAEGAARAISFLGSKRTGTEINASVRAIYGQLKNDLYPNDPTDDGAQVSDALLMCVKYGYVDESMWPFVDTDAIVQPPPPQLWNSSFKLKGFQRVDNTVDAMEMALYHRGILICGGQWAAEWEGGVSLTGILPPPLTDAGGHCYAIDGYSRTMRRAFGGVNSWGTDWADEGRFWMSYDYVNTPYWPTDVFTVTG